MKKLLWIVPIILAFGVLAWPWPTNPPYKTVDFLQIGDVASEASHSISGWGPVEPDTHGGGWGDLANDVDKYTDRKTRVVWNKINGDSDFFSERSAEFTMTIAKRCAPLICNRQWLRADRLKIRYLDGQANDDFIVLWKNPKGNWELIDVVVTDHANINEVWKIEEISLVDKIPAQYRIGGGKQLTFEIVATGSAWSGFGTWGQVGIDYIWLEQP